MTDFEALLQLLARASVEFIIVGGAAATVHGSSRLTQCMGTLCSVLGLERLIEVKRAAGRPKDFEAIAELEKILEARERG